MTDILRVVDILPDEAKHLAQKLHRKKDEIEIYRKALIGEVEASVDEERTIVARVSTNDRDRDGEIVEPKGIDLKDFQANPVLLWAHNYSTPPVGKALWSKTDENGLICKFQFAQTQFAEDIYQLYKGGYLRAFSIGFIPVDYDSKSKTFNKISLLEVSAVPVPANQSALVMEAYAKGIVTSEALKAEFCESLPMEGYIEVSPDGKSAVEVTLSGSDTGEVTIDTALADEAVPALTPVVDEAAPAPAEVEDELELDPIRDLRAAIENLALQQNALIKRIDELVEKVEAKTAPLDIQALIDGGPTGGTVTIPAGVHEVKETIVVPEGVQVEAAPAPAPEAKSTITITSPEPVKSDAQVLLEFVRSRDFSDMIRLEVDKAIGRVR